MTVFLKEKKVMHTLFGGHFEPETQLQKASWTSVNYAYRGYYQTWN